VAFSRDEQWMAYVEFPGGALASSRVDGSERRQLTFPPMRAFSPQWSPDGKQIAFQAAAKVGAHAKIYLISSGGGVPVLAAPGGPERQTYPSWAADGGAILFSSSDEVGSNPALHMLDLKTNRVLPLPGSAGLYLGRLSPDGRYVIAVEDITHRLMLYDTANHNARPLAEAGDYPRWSADGQYAYFDTLQSPLGRRKTAAVFRVKISTNTIETVNAYPDFHLAGIYGLDYGLTPGGEILLLRDLGNRDVYALDMELP
jgi:Tol biopolymer transport system component